MILQADSSAIYRALLLTTQSQTLLPGDYAISALLLLIEYLVLVMQLFADTLAPDTATQPHGEAMEED